MTKAKIYTYLIPGDLPFVGKPLWDKITVKDALRDLRDIERGMTHDLEEFPGHPQEHLVIAVLNQARASRHRLEEDEGTLAAAITDVEHLEKNIIEIRLRAGESDRRQGVKFRPKGRGPDPVSKAIDAALKELDTPSAKASSRQIFNHVVKNTDALDRRHNGGLSEHIEAPASVTCANGSDFTWRRFGQKISERRKKCD